MDLRSKDAIESSKQHDIEMSNILIAEFMGFKECEGSYYRPLYNSGDWVSDVDLKFDTSWDWLIPVVDKIKILVMKDDSDELYNSVEWDNITHTLVQIEIKSVYQAVVEFIKNQNN